MYDLVIYIFALWIDICHDPLRICEARSGKLRCRDLTIPDFSRCQNKHLIYLWHLNMKILAGIACDVASFSTLWVWCLHWTRKFLDPFVVFGGYEFEGVVPSYSVSCFRHLSIMCVNIGENYGLKIVLVCLCITLPHHQHYVDLTASIEACPIFSVICYRLCFNDWATVLCCEIL